MWPECHTKGKDTKLSWRGGQRAEGREPYTAWLRGSILFSRLQEWHGPVYMERDNCNNVARAIIESNSVRTQRKGDPSVSGVMKGSENTFVLTNEGSVESSP